MSSFPRPLYVVDISSWQLDDAEGGSSPYIFPTETVIPAGNFFLVSKEMSQLSLNNDADEARLFDSYKNLLSVVSYEDAKEGDILFYKDSKYIWENNEISLDSSLAQYYVAQEAIPSEEVEEVLGVEIEEEPHEDSGGGSGTPWRATTPTKTIKEAKTRIGEQITLQGKVTVMPGTWSKQYGYIEDETGGIQFYSSKGDFPKLSLGDEIRVSGEISVAYGEARIKIKEKEGLSLVGVAPARPLPLEITMPNETYVDTLIKISGTLLEKKSKEWYINVSGKELKVPIRFSQENATSSPKEGDEVSIVGILRKRNEQIELWSRDNADITPLFSSTPTNSSSFQEHLAFEADSLSFWPYFFTLSSLFIAFLGVLWWQYRSSCKKLKNQL